MICEKCFTHPCRCVSPHALAWFILCFLLSVASFLIFGLTEYSFAWSLAAWILLTLSVGSYLVGRYLRG